MTTTPDHITRARQLLDRLDAAAQRPAWQDVADTTTPNSGAGRIARAHLDRLPTALDALGAATELATAATTRQAWDMLAAREDGASWDQITAAMGMEPWEAADVLRRAAEQMAEPWRARAAAVLPALPAEADEEPLADVAAAAERYARLHTVAQRLAWEHADLPLYRMYPERYYGADHEERMSLRVYAPTREQRGAGVHAWAAVLGVAVVETVTASTLPGGRPDRHWTATAEVDGIRVNVWDMEYLTEAEAAQWAAEADGQEGAAVAAETDAAAAAGGGVG